MDELSKRQLVSGLLLIAVGAVMYYVLRAQDHLSIAALLVLLGTAFVGAYLYYRNYGYLVPGCLLCGFGAGRMWSATTFSVGDPTMIGLGAGFIAIYLVALLYQRKSPWWPLIPGCLLLLLGLGFKGGIQYLFENWPLILILVGVILVVSAFVRLRRA
jgi:hypothetical protein